MVERGPLPKYALLECERRFLATPATLPPLASAAGWEIADRYLDDSRGRLRLRRMTPVAGGAPVYKLAKKYGGGGDPAAAPITNLYLSVEEYALLSRLPGRDLRKRRTPWIEAGQTFSVDVFAGPLAGLVLVEAEAPSPAALAVILPLAWADREVTADPFFTGGHLVTLDAPALQTRLASLFAPTSGAI